MTAPTNASRCAFALRASPGPDHVVEAEDALDAKRALSRLGYYRTADGSSPGPWVDSGLFNGIRQFQRDDNRKVDGLIRPGGETERAINVALKAEDRPANDDQPPANDDEQYAFRDCEYQKFLDDMKCRGVADRATRGLCFTSAQQRYANCLRHGYPYPDLFLG